MPTLTLHRKQPLIPYWVFINGQHIGIMQSKEASIAMPAGRHTLSVQIILGHPKWHLHVGSQESIVLSEEQHLNLMITHKERWWNLLFDIDIIIWIAQFFLEFPSPWDTLYEVLSGGFFILWSARTWIIRHRYFNIITINNAYEQT